MLTPLKCSPLGDTALILTYSDTISRETSQRVWEDAERIAANKFPHVSDIVPGYVTLAIYFDHRQTSYDEIEDLVIVSLREATAFTKHQHREIIIPVRYNGSDLEDVARQTGLSVTEVIDRHSNIEYYTYMLGFVPGFAYLGDLDPALRLPRKATPRKSVAVGSVAIAGAQTAVYPLTTPGGWHIIGHTELVMFDPTREDPSLLKPGDLVRFEVVHP